MLGLAGLGWPGLAWAANYPWTTVLLVLETALLVTRVTQPGHHHHHTQHSGVRMVTGRGESLCLLSQESFNHEVLWRVPGFCCWSSCCSAAVLQCGRMMKCNELRTAVRGGPSTVDRVKPQLQVFSREV